MSGTPDSDIPSAAAPAARSGAQPAAAPAAEAVDPDAASAMAGSADAAIDLERPLADQAAVLMLGDLRSYMQGSEQMLMAATAQAMPNC